MCQSSSERIVSPIGQISIRSAAAVEAKRSRLPVSVGAFGIKAERPRLPTVPAAAEERELEGRTPGDVITARVASPKSQRSGSFYPPEPIEGRKIERWRHSASAKIRYNLPTSRVGALQRRLRQRHIFFIRLKLGPVLHPLRMARFGATFQSQRRRMGNGRELMHHLLPNCPKI